MKLRVLALAAALSAACLPAIAQSAPSVRDLAGLWQAQRRTPALEGVAVVEHGADGWRAELRGVRAAGVETAGRVAFDLGEGRVLTLDPRPVKGALRGWWQQGPGAFNAYGFLTPVTLAAEAKGRWSGRVEPLPDQFTLHLPVTVGADGKAAAFLRNPEQNAGRMLDVRRVELADGQARLMGFPFGARIEEAVATGPFDADNEVLSLYMPRVGQAYEFRRVGDGNASGFHPRAQPSAGYRYQVPPARSDGWPTASVEQVGISREAIEALVRRIIDTPDTGRQSSRVHALLIARHGRLVVEEYFHGFDRDTLHDTRSAGKSLTATITGAAIQAGYPLSTSTPVYPAMNGGVVPDGLDPRKRAMTVEHLLTMTSGYHCDDEDPVAPGNEDTMQSQRVQRDWYRFTLDLPMAFAPGERAIYCSVNPNLLGGVVARAAGRPQEDLFRDLVAEPLGIRRYALNTQPTGEPYMGGGLYMAPRDYIKLGQMMMDGGVWKGRRVVSRAWAERATAPLQSIGGRGYGYLWWSQDYPYRGGTVRAIYAAGNGGQIVMIVPELDLLISFWGGNYGERAARIPQEVYVPELILPAVAR